MGKGAMNSPAGDLTAFNLYFADGQFLLLARSADGLVDRIRCFAEANIPEFSFAPVDENSFEEMCRRSNAQVFLAPGRPTAKEFKQLTVLSRARHAMRIVAWEDSDTPQKEVTASDLVQVPIADENSMRLLFSIIAAGSAPDVFISYSRVDSAFVDAINARLRRFGLKTWVDRTRIQSGEAWMDAIVSGVRSARTFLFVVTPDSVKSAVCLRELDFAVQSRKRLFAVMRRSTRDSDVPSALSDIQRFSFLEDTTFDSTAERLRDDILRDADFERWAARVLLQAAKWTDRGRPRDLLLSKAELRESRDLLRHSASAQLPRISAEYLTESRGNLNRTRGVYAASALALLAVSYYIAATLLSYFLTNRSNALRADNPESSLQFAKLAVQNRRTGPALEALRDSLVKSREAAYVSWSLGGAFQHGGPGFVTIGAGQARNAKLESLIQFWRPGHRQTTLTVPAGAAISFVDRRGNSALFMTVVDHILYGCLLGANPSCFPLDSTKQFLNGATFSADGKEAAALRETGWEIWSLEERKLRFQFPVSSSESVVFSAVGNFMYHPGADGQIEEVDRLTGTALRKLPGGEGPVFMLRVSPDARWLLRLSERDEPTLIELPTGKRLQLRTGFGTYLARFSRSSKFIGVANPSGVLLFSAGTTTPAMSIPVPTGVVGDIDFRLDDGAILLAIGKTAQVYSLTEELRPLAQLVGHELSLRLASFDQTGTRALTWGDSSTRGWDLSADRNEVNFVSKGISVLAFSADGQELANDDGPFIRVTRVDDGHLLRTFPLDPHDGPVLGMNYPEPHRMMVVQASGRLTVWDDNAPSAPLRNQSIGQPVKVCFAKAAQTMAVLRRDQSIVLQRSDGQIIPVSPPSTTQVFALGCSADGRFVAAGTWTPAVATIWDTRYLTSPARTSLGITTVSRLDRSARFKSFSDFLHNLSIVTTAGFYENSAALGFQKLKFSSDGQRVLSTTVDFAPRIWDTTTGTMVEAFRARFAEKDASWSPDGKLVASAHASRSGDQAVCIWDVHSGALIAEIPSLHTEANLVEFSPDGRRLAVADADGVVHLYARERFAPVQEIVELIQRRTSRLLEHSEWKLKWLWR